MTATADLRPCPRTPWPVRPVRTVRTVRAVRLVRLLVAVEITIVCAGLVFLGSLTLLGVSWGLAGGDVDVAATVALLTLLAMLMTFVIRSVTAATRLHRDRERARTTLVPLQWALLAVLLLATPITDGWLGVGFADQPVLLLVLLVSGGVALVALQRLRTRRRPPSTASAAP